MAYSFLDFIESSRQSIGLRLSLPSYGEQAEAYRLHPGPDVRAGCADSQYCKPSQRKNANQSQFSTQDSGARLTSDGKLRSPAKIEFHHAIRSDRHRERSRRLLCGRPRRPVRTENRPHRKAGQTGRHLPAGGLHSHQGPAPYGRCLGAFRASGSGRHPVREPAPRLSRRCSTARTGSSPSTPRASSS